MILFVLSILLFFLVYKCMPFMIAFAMKFKLYDIPSARKMHTAPIPRLGGIVISFFFLIGVFVFDFFEHTKDFQLFITGALLIIVMGVVDDLVDLSASFKFTVQGLIAYIMVSNGLIVPIPDELLSLLGNSEFITPVISFLFIVGVINAMNLIDGVNGLASGIGMINFFFFAVLAIHTHNILIVGISILFLAALAGFIPHNFPNARIFLGDSGSLLVGYITVFCGLDLIQGATQIYALNNYFQIDLILLSCMLLPLFDEFRLFAERMINGNSPFKADTNHIHHLILKTNFSAQTTTELILTSHVWIIMASIGFQLFFSKFIVFVLLSLISVTYLNVHFFRYIKTLSEDYKRTKELLNNIQTDNN
jgi:UDP-GlcNAc:undecaprenyl-phosphate/decaprenyl-phosphate GlcNAc-1-phosphate transferase